MIQAVFCITFKFYHTPILGKEPVFLIIAVIQKRTLKLLVWATFRCAVFYYIKVVQNKFTYGSRNRRLITTLS